jgi:hypothetical protein
MAKGRVGVLEAHEASNSAAPQTFCGRAIADRLLANGDARQIGKRLIQMLSAKARDAIQQAKTARDAIAAMVEQLKPFCYFDGPLGIGNVLPFARLKNNGDKLHYEMPMAGDKGMRRHGLYYRKDELRTHAIHVSSRNFFSRQLIPA